MIPHSSQLVGEGKLAPINHVSIYAVVYLLILNPSWLCDPHGADAVSVPVLKLKKFCKFLLCNLGEAMPYAKVAPTTSAASLLVPAEYQPCL